jgi:DUF1365 family protein
MSTQHCHIASGWVRHRRLGAVPNQFRYPLGWLMLDLAEGPHLFAQRWWAGWRSPGLWRFHRRDFLARPEADLATAVRSLVQERLGVAVTGSIQLVSTLRGFGLCFNPVSFYLCRNHDDRVMAVVAEITNTPWRERHQVVLSARDDGNRAIARGTMEKTFHVSPFQPMTQVWEWTFAITPERFVVHMTNREAGKAVFDADLRLALRPATPARLLRHLWTWPCMAALALLLIHWQALRLWWRGARVFDHPSPRDRAPYRDPQAA